MNKKVWIALLIVTFLLLFLPIYVNADVIIERHCRSTSLPHEFNVLHGYSKNPPGMIIDHICALECGGLDILDNLQYQSKAASKDKDRWERTVKGCIATCNPTNSKPIRTVYNCK